MVICRGAVAVCAAASVTLAVKLTGPAAAGIPDNTPAEESVNPLGGAPTLTLQE
jgi:hypothetical protein